MTRTLPRRRSRHVVYIHASIDAREITPRTVEYEVFHRRDAHEWTERTQRDLVTLARDPDFAGVVVSDIGHARCPRCECKLDWRP